MLARQLWEKYPQMFHMAEPGSWPSIQKHGLLSTSSLLDLFEKPRKDRIAIETCLAAQRGAIDTSRAWERRDPRSKATE